MQVSINVFQVKFGQDYGCIGMILYSDPADYAVEGIDLTYPDAWYLPGTGVQRGTIRQNRGDALTPGYPAIGN